MIICRDTKEADVASFDIDIVKYRGENEDFVDVPAGTMHIGSGAFAGHNELVSVLLPEYMVYLGHAAFRCCTSLCEVTIPRVTETMEGDPYILCSDDLIFIKRPDEN